jgi:CRISPR-associated protein Cmr1
LITSDVQPSNELLPQLKRIDHPECERQNKEIDPLLYLANMGIMGQRGKVNHSYFPPNSNFRWVIDYPCEKEKDVSATLALIQAFGTIGARCRNGWGSFQVKPGIIQKQDAIDLLNSSTKEWTEGFRQDYPNCLGKDENRLLIWKTKNTTDKWEEAMGQLAEAYVGIRAKNVGGIPKLDGDGADYPGERHLLGFPLTNHFAQKAQNWGKRARHSSPLRFFIRKKQEGLFIGFVLHLPHRFSDQMNPMPKSKQIEVWEKVHKKLDILLKRATYEECL